MTNLKNIISASQFRNKKRLKEIFHLADKIRSSNSDRLIKVLKNKIMAALFYEPSTRTRFSFESAMLRLGGDVISTESAGLFSSAIKGETLEDTIKVVGSYVDVIILRHSQVGSAQKASEVSSVPIINAGDGSGEHPTQAILDVYTIWKELGRVDNLRVAMVGDLLYGRTVHSLIHLLSVFKNLELFLISPKELSLPNEYRSFLKKYKIKFYEHEDLKDVLGKVDIFYITRIQKERFSSEMAYEKVKNLFIIDRKLTEQMRKDAVIMHPLPRVNEINSEVDSDRRAAYFRQASNGLYVRMALLVMLLGIGKIELGK